MRGPAGAWVKGKGPMYLPVPPKTGGPKFNQFMTLGMFVNKRVGLTDAAPKESCANAPQVTPGRAAKSFKDFHLQIDPGSPPDLALPRSSGCSKRIILKIGWETRSWSTRVEIGDELEAIVLESRLVWVTAGRSDGPSPS